MLDTFRQFDTAAIARDQVATDESLPEELRDGLCDAIAKGRFERAFLRLRTTEEISLLEKTLVGLNESAGLSSDLREVRGVLGRICDGLAWTGSMTAPAISALGMDGSQLMQIERSYTPENFQNIISKLLLDIGEFKRRRSSQPVPTIGNLGTRHQTPEGSWQDSLPAAK